MPEAADSELSSDLDAPLADSGITEIPPADDLALAEAGGRLSQELGGRLADESASRLSDAMAALTAGAAETGVSDADEAQAGEGADEAGEDQPAPPRLETELTTEQVIESILFAADTPLTLPKIVSILGVGSARDVRKHVNALNKRYDEQGAAFRIEAIAGGYQMLTRPEYNTWLRRLRQNKQDSRLSQAAMETLAVVAYKQPVVRAEIEAIRGVQSGEMLNRLRELGLVKIVGRAEDVGRPMLYGTTKRFLEVFGLSALEDLPEVEELKTDEE